MLMKCFKYDFKYIIKTWWLAAVSLILTSFGAGYGYRNLAIYALYSTAPDKHFVLEYGLIVVYIIAVGALTIFTQVLLSIRLYTNFYSDEGYLTFTLPVKRSTLLKAKIYSGFLFELLTAVTILTSIIIILVMVPSEYKEYSNLLEELVIEFKNWYILEITDSDKVWLATYFIQAIIFGVLYLLACCTTLFMLITLGATLAKKFKVGAIIGFIVGADYVFSILSVATMISLSLWMNAATHLYFDKMSDTAGFSFIFLLLLLFIIILSSVIILFVNITQGLIDRKLNMQ